MPRLRVAHVYKDVYPPVVGGIEKHIDLLRRAMPGVDAQTIVCSRGRRSSVRHTAAGLEVRVAEFGPRWLSVPVAPTFPRWLDRLEADLIHLHMPNPLGEASVLLAADGRPFVVSYHADIVRQARFMRLYRPLVNACLERAEAVVVGSSRLLETSPLLRRDCPRAHVVPYGVDVEALDPGRVPAAKREALRARFGTPLVVAIARLVYYKGIEHLIEAARRLDAAVVVVGSGPLEERLRGLAAGAPNVHLVGEVPEAELPVYLAAADCFVLPSTSRAESFGVATLEAQAMGVPAVVTDVGTGTLDAIEPGETGLAVPPASPGPLAEAIGTILGDPARAEAMGRAARERVVRERSHDGMLDSLRDIYARATGSAAG